jgi:peptidyl-prolyl cis-trans isomerase A (cyclophilin A)
MSSRLLGTSCIALLLSCVFACKGQEPTTPVDGEDPAKLDFKLADAVAGLEGSGALTAKLETNHGVLVVKLFEAEVPKTVANFVGLARGLRPWRDPKTGDWVKRPFYDGLTFHRVIPDFMIQGGDPLGVGNGGPGYQFGDEFVPSLRHDKPGRLSMANAGPGTNGSQFFVTEAPTPHLDDRHTIFGEVVEGLDVVKTIARVPVGAANRPTEPVVIQKITLYRQ